MIDVLRLGLPKPVQQFADLVSLARAQAGLIDADLGTEHGPRGLALDRQQLQVVRLVRIELDPEDVERALQG